MLISAAGQVNHTNSTIPKDTLEIDFTWPPSDLNTRFRRLYFLLPLQDTRVLRASSSDNTRGADKSLARSGRKQATASKTCKIIPIVVAYKQQQYIPVVCTS